MDRIRAFFTLTRPVNVLIGGISIFMGAFIAGSIHPLSKVMLAVLSGALLAGAANSINDYFDVNIDKINKPYRPIPSGRLTRKESFIFSIILFSLGTFLTAFINWKALVIALLSCFVLYAYSAHLKRTVLWGNFSVSLMTALAFIFGGIAVDRLNAAIIPAGFAFLYHFGREIIKDMEDREGDMSEGIRTLPLVYGNKVAMLFTTCLYILLIIITYVPYVLRIFGITYLLVVSLGVNVVLIYSMISMWKRPVPENLGRLSTLLKMDMFVGLIAIYLGRY